MDKKGFEVGAGVNWINGQKTRAGAILKLTPGEAAFDLAQGRLRPAAEKEPRRKKESVSPQLAQELSEVDVEASADERS